MSWEALASILYAAAILLVFVELLVPGGLLGILGVLLILTSSGVVIFNGGEYRYFVVFGELIGLVASFFLGMYLLSNTRVGNHLVMHKRQKVSDGWVAPSEDPALVGSEGDVLTALRPAGSISVEGRRIDAVSAGEFIDRGARICVIEVEGNRVVVEESNKVRA